MTNRIIISGYGGQGVLSAGIMMAEAAMAEGHQVTFFPSYGAEMRGGTANCYVVISDREIASPVIVTADTLIALNQPSLDKFLPRTKKDGLVLLNSSYVREGTDLGGRKTVRIPVEDLAMEKLGSTKVINVIILGAFAKATGLLTADKLKKSVEEKFRRKGEKIVDLNYRALDLGFGFRA